MDFALSQDENKELKPTSQNVQINMKRAVPIVLSDSNIQKSNSLPTSQSLEKRLHLSFNDNSYTTPSVQSINSTSSVKTPLLSTKSLNSLKRLSSSRSTGTLLFTSNRKLSTQKRSSSLEKPIETSSCLAVDNSIKTNVSFLFDASVSYQSISVILMAIRRSQIGFYSNIVPSKTVSRGNITTSGITQFVEGTIDAYHTFITTRPNPLQDDTFFYLKGYNFSVMFTHDKEGNPMCLASLPSDMVNQLSGEDVRFVRMKDEDEDEIAEEDLLSYRSNSRLLPSVSSLHQPEHINTGISIYDALSIFKFVNFLINYSIHLGETKVMTQIISSFPFAHSSWVMLSPIFKKNILHKNTKSSSLTINGIITKKQLHLLCSIINTTFEKLGIFGSYSVNLSTDRSSQLFNVKNSTTTIEGKFLQSIQCTMKKEDRSISYVNTTKSVVL